MSDAALRPTFPIGPGDPGGDAWIRAAILVCFACMVVSALSLIVNVLDRFHYL